MSDSRNRETAKQEQDKLNVLGHQAKKVGDIEERANEILQQTNDSVAASENVLERYGKQADPATASEMLRVCLPRPVLRPWDELVAEAEENLDAPVSFSDILSLDEMDAAALRVSEAYEEFNECHRLDAAEWSICGCAGMLAALVDTFLIQMPKHAAFLGSKGAEGGPLANWIRVRVNLHFTEDEIRQLERDFRVPYDHANSCDLQTPVAGLNPGSHRFQSLGHDPVLGFLFGVKDLLLGTFTAIDKNGQFTVQESASDATAQAMGLFEAVRTFLGHLKSDVATPAGLPVPLMPLLQMMQVGRFGKRGHTIGDLSRAMYRNNYDFRHFLAMSISPLLVEIVVRLFYFGKRLHEGESLDDAVPFNIPGTRRKPKLGTMLFVSHFMSTAVNAGRMKITRDPLTINAAQWAAFLRYATLQVKWTLHQKDVERCELVQAALAEQWNDVYHRLNMTWEHTFPSNVTLD